MTYAQIRYQLDFTCDSAYLPRP